MGGVAGGSLGPGALIGENGALSSVDPPAPLPMGGGGEAWVDGAGARGAPLPPPRDKDGM